MGATVFEEEKPGVWLVGSFGGLERFEPETNEVRSVMQSKSPSRPGRPASTLIGGYIVSPDGDEYIVGHYKGISDTKENRKADLFVMPEQIRRHYRMPLWNFLFELHNGRLFKGMVGSFYMLIVPLGGIFGLLILLSGVFDYWYLKLAGKKNRSHEAEG